MKPQPRYQPGDKIGGRYQVHQALMGGMGEVYLCLDLETIQPYALKTFQQRYLTNPKVRELFKQEVATWIELGKHPNIVRCFNMETLDSQPFMILEWVANNEGTDLRSWLARRLLALQLALDFAIDICRGLLHAQHTQPGIVHRDLKPDNILVNQRRIAKITDFGLATIVQGADLELDATVSNVNTRQSIWASNRVAGTPLYMSPEQWRKEELDARTDIYALGCILYELVSGNQPFKGKTVNELRQAHMRAPIPKLLESPLSVINPILERCLAKEREQRFTTVKELKEELTWIYTEQFKQPPRAVNEVEEFTATDYLSRGNAYDELQLYEQALADYNQAIAENPKSAWGYNDRGVTYLNMQSYDDALADFSQAVAFAPQFAEAYGNRAIAYDRLRRYDEALDDHNHAIALAPLRAKLYSNRGLSYLALQRYDEALADFSQAVKLDPRNAINFIIRANAFSSLRQYDKALADYAQASTLDPMLVEVYKKRGEVYHNQYLRKVMSGPSVG